MADSAEAVNGKVYILGGGIDRHLATDFPAALRADIALGVLVDWAETNNRHALSVKILDEDSTTVVAIEGEFEAGRPPGARLGQDMRTMLAICGPFVVPNPGAYKLVVELNGREQEPPFRFWVDKFEPPRTTP